MADVGSATHQRPTPRLRFTELAIAPHVTGDHRQGATP